MLKISETTPVEERGGILFKRDDAFEPFFDIPLNGGKVRQWLSVLRANEELIKARHKDRIIATTFVNSPQGLIITRCANEFGFTTDICLGSSPNTALRHKPMLLAKENGANLVRVANAGHRNVVEAEMQKYARENNAFILTFETHLVIDTIVSQVENIPDELDRLIIPGGSCLTAAAILRGVRRYNKRIKEIFVVQISNKDLRKRLIEHAPGVPFTYVQSDAFKYSLEVKVNFNGINLDSIYEAKAWDWFMKQPTRSTDKNLFWIVSNFNDFRG